MYIKLYAPNRLYNEKWSIYYAYTVYALPIRLMIEHWVIKLKYQHLNNRNRPSSLYLHEILSYNQIALGHTKQIS